MRLEPEVAASLAMSTTLGCVGALSLCMENVEVGVLSGAALLAVAIIAVVRGSLRRSKANMFEITAAVFTSAVCNDLCSICLVQFEEGEEICTLPCRHGYHEVCLKTWLLWGCRCPQCRQFIPNRTDF